MAQKLTYRTESWAQYYADAQFLWPQHYQDLWPDKKNIPLKPDTNFYEACASADCLQIVTGRDNCGLLAAYHLTIIRPNSYSADILCGFEDTRWMDPLYRKGTEGIRLMRAALEELKARGVKQTVFMSIDTYPTDKLLTYMGFQKTHSTYSLWLGD